MALALLFTLSALAGEEPALAPQPDPIVEWAERDLRSTSRARMGLTLSVIGAPLFALGGSYAALGMRPGEQVAANTIMVGGLGAAVAGPALLASGTLRSQRALSHQDVRITRLPGSLAMTFYVGALLWTLTPTSSGGINEGLFYSTWIALYGSALTAGVVQLQINQRARRQAGWLANSTVMPSYHNGNVGLAVASRF